MQAAVPAGPVTVQDLEILEYKRKLHKLERIKREWVDAFDEKLAIYRSAVEHFNPPSNISNLAFY